ncbi:hypothetical protein HN670_00300 [bacterium]|jgi:pyruvate,water dikinase|nr:hypothetical protein [bacterium]
MAKNIYDNSNLAESYSGITTPLTFSFARRVYQDVYKSFCQIMGVSKKSIKANDDMFPEMVVFIGHRMYYNLINWYRLISLLPGYKLNRRFLEKMLGVEKEHNYTNQQRYSFWQKYFLDFPNLVWQVFKIIFLFLFMGGLIRNFNRKFDIIFARSSKLDLSSLDLKKLRAVYISLVKNLTRRWRVPIANDLAVMISTGVADKLFKKWLKQDDVYEYLKMSSHASLISLDPGLEILAISEKIKNDTTLSELFIKNDTNKIWLQLENEYKNTKVAEMIFYYLKKFGSRSPNELKLESITLEEDPKIFINCLKKIVSSPNANNLSKKTNIKEQTKSIKNKNISWVKKIVLNIIIKWSVNSIRRREETRFKRTLIFGFARKIFLQMGRLFVKLNLMKSHRDIFYLKTGEIFSIIDQKMSKDDVDKLIQNRKVTIKKWRGIELPRRIETDKTIKEQEQEFLIKTDIEVERTDLFGVIASKAKQSHIDGEALVLTDFDPVADYSNKILVTRQTDPGWSIVFPLIKGLVVERGGMLSHAAIVARELGIPCLIGATNATSLVKDNSKVILNFSTGQISYE